MKQMPDIFPATPKHQSREVVDQRDHMLHFLCNNVIREGGDDDHAALIEEVTLRSFYDNLFATAFPSLSVEALEDDLKDYDCYRFLIDSFENSCGKFTDYAFKYAKYLRHVCIVGDAEMIGDTAAKIHELCQ